VRADSNSDRQPTARARLRESLAAMLTGVPAIRADPDVKKGLVHRQWLDQGCGVAETSNTPSEALLSADIGAAPLRVRHSRRACPRSSRYARRKPLPRSWRPAHPAADDHCRRAGEGRHAARRTHRTSRDPCRMCASAGTEHMFDPRDNYAGAVPWMLVIQMCVRVSTTRFSSGTKAFLVNAAVIARSFIRSEGGDVFGGSVSGAAPLPAFRLISAAVLSTAFLHDVDNSAVPRCWSREQVLRRATAR